MFGNYESAASHSEPCEDTPYLKAPNYGSYTCQTDENTSICRATCDQGFQFPDKVEEILLSCDRNTGIWSPIFFFPDCNVKCQIPERPKNSELQCYRSNEDQKRYICNAVCETGFQLPDGTKETQHFCDLTTLQWYPRPYFIDCASLCQNPSKPLNGDVSCFRSAEDSTRYVCQATCDDGFEFSDGHKKVEHFCSLKTGEWSPKMEFQDCVRTCSPPCQNKGVCAANNTCVCEQRYRGDRCEYDRELCKPSKTFHGSAVWNCIDTTDGYSCFIKCSEGTSFEYPPSNVYHCSLSGIWEPSKAPTCKSVAIIPGPPAGERDQSSEPPESAVCAAWNHHHYSTFDGTIYNFKSPCTYVLAKDCVDNTFAIHITSKEHEKQSVVIYVGKATYALTYNAGVSAVEHNGTSYPIPAWIDGLLFKSLTHYVTVLSNSLGFGLKWDRKSVVLLKAFGTMFNKTCGLCGHFDGVKEDDWKKPDGTVAFDVESFVSSWKVENVLDKCDGTVDIGHPCSSGDSSLVKKATQVCQAIMDSRFQPCHKMVKVEKYYEACMMDYCECESPDTQCICNTLSQYFRECVRLGQRLKGGWRNDTLCPLHCEKGMVYDDCGSMCPKTCENRIYNCEDDHCVDGCHCPFGTVLYNGQCIVQEECPCEKDGKVYQKGEKIERNCKTCICINGQFECAEDTCMATCLSVGGSHYTTFDGTTYNSITTCPVYLVYNENFTIIQENTECPDRLRTLNSEYCTKEIQINTKDSSLVLKSDPAPIFNGRQVPDHPFTENGVTVYRATSSFIKVELPNGVSVLWNGKNQIFIDAPSSLMYKTKGLCGTYNHCQKDDFRTPNGDIDEDIVSFTKRWQYFDTCYNRYHFTGQSECDQQAQNIEQSETFCSVLKNDLFSACHNVINPEEYYRVCKNVFCSCQDTLYNCLCPVLKHYSYLCARKGVILNWVNELEGCKPQCDVGKIYQECSNPCKSSCRTIAEAKHCVKTCVPGCACPAGQTLDDEGNCITIDRCPCVVDGREYSAQSSSIQGANICDCDSAILRCRPASDEELHNPFFNRSFTCSHNEEYTSCVQDCPETCQNMHLQQHCHTKVCKPGCKCKEGYILDLGKCIKRSECGCRHGGQKYNEGDTMKYDCNVCNCTGGQWKCSKKICPGRCTVWGSSHFKTFDGNMYDFNGDCEYVLSIGDLGDGTNFSVSMQNVPCGTSGVTCSKTFTLDLYKNGTQQKRIVLSESVPLPKEQYTSPFAFDNGLYVFVYTDIGLSLQWDKGTRMYVILEPTWRSRVLGLCGNYDDDWENDFQTPAKGLPEVQPNMFADSWKMRESCSHPGFLYDACSRHPYRRTWARKKCSVLNSPLFEPCHSEVNVRPYYDKCVYDTCTCDEGGDCECLCTSIATYAQECNNNGVHIKWRSQELCPIQCENCAKYESCMPLCPVETCENQDLYRNIESYCTSDICIEGCSPDPCPPGEIFNSSRDNKCIPRVDCVVPCREIDGKMYHEGQRVPMVDQECLTCHCVHGEVFCSGPACHPPEEMQPCADGWTSWFNITTLHGGKYETLEQLVNSSALKQSCGLWNISDMQCVVGSKPVNCDAHGAICSTADNQTVLCKSYWARLYCNCGAATAVTSSIPPTYFIPTATATSICPEGQVYDDCAYRCNQTCHSFAQALFAHKSVCHMPDSTECIAGCRPIRNCEVPNFWRDYFTCIRKEDCPCSVVNGDGTVHMLNPHEVVDQECKKCQCIDNQLQCLVVPDCTTVTSVSPIYTIFETTPSLVTPAVTPSILIDIQRPDCWTEWINNSSLGVGGQFEELNSIRKKYLFCSNPVQIECRTVADKRNAIETGQKLICDLNIGLQCYDSENSPDGCFDYEIRFFCPCELTTVTIPPSIVPTVLPIAPCVHGWTEWYSSHVPDAKGEVETIQSVREKGAYFCDSSMITAAECRQKGMPEGTPLQPSVICNLHYGLQCQNDQLDELETCSDYEIRFFCDCPELPAMSTVVSISTSTTSVIPSAAPCIHGWTEWYSSHIPDEEGDIETIQSVRGKGAYFCDSSMITIIECKEKGVPEGTALQPNVLCDLENGLMCRNDQLSEQDVCKDYEVRFFCNCPELVTASTLVSKFSTFPPIVTPPMLSPVAPCTHGWTSWYSSHAPDTKGVVETIQSVREKGAYFCDSNMITEISCKEKGMPEGTPLPPGVICDLQRGLICENDQLSGQEMCKEYEIKFFCNCPVLSTVSTTVSTISGSTEKVTTVSSCTSWSHWINEHHPNYAAESGDKENKTLLELQQNDRFCLNGYLSDIECRDAATDVNYNEATDLNLVCSLVDGFRCFGKDQPSGVCQDYKIRYFCNCEMPATSSVIVHPTPTTSVLGVCSSYYYLVNGPKRLSDSHFRASSSRSAAKTGPQNARLNHVKTETQAGGWMPSDKDPEPFLELDLGSVKSVFGVVTKGGNGYPSWVTSYRVLFSRDNVSYSYVRENFSDNKPTVFVGNHDSDTRIVHIFRKPFDARFIRFEPLTREREYIMRADVLSCADGTSYEITFNYTEPQCRDEMGLYNGMIKDEQITFSSNRAKEVVVSTVRLHSKRIGAFGGGWTAKDLTDHEYVQIDFLEPRTLTGVSTQGRAHIEQWVSSYEVRYSKDGSTWHSVLNDIGQVQIFSGNYDRDSVVTNYFYRPIRARYIRVIPKTWYRWIAMRLEIMGCFEAYGGSTTVTTSGSTASSHTGSTITVSPTATTGTTITIPPTAPSGTTITIPPTAPSGTTITISPTAPSGTAITSCLENGPWLSLHDSTYVEGDREPIDKIINASGLCASPVGIECREIVTHASSATRENVICDLSQGLVCDNSKQPSGLCPNYEVRIICYTCGPVTTVPYNVTSSCPEMPGELINRCPTSCPNDYVCDGTDCVPYTSCPCFKEKRFQPGDIHYTSDCQLCKCMIGGRSKCNLVVCDHATCGENEISVLNANCQCECQKCPPGERLCPTSNECIDEARWCDGVADCSDDELYCPTIPPQYPSGTFRPTPVVPTSPPPQCPLDQRAGSCSMTSSVIQTFDNRWYNHEICHHILVEEKVDHSFSITVHSTCNDSTQGSVQCGRYLRINAGGTITQLGPGPDDAFVNTTKIETQNMWLISKNNKKSFSLRKSGSVIIFESYRYHFRVSWDSWQSSIITVSECLLYDLVGLCGNYNNEPADDLQTPGGIMAAGPEEFVNSWSIGGMGPCVLPTCSVEVRNKSIEVCSQLNQSPFNECSSYLNMDAQIEACLSYMCDCLQDVSNMNKLDECRCQVYGSFTEKCEAEKGTEVHQWRIKYSCPSKCEAGLEWMSCGRGCELTCDNYRHQEDICDTKCVPGCYCPPGLVRQFDQCVSPKQCADCQCAGQGDPNYVTFDQEFYSFQGNCTYILAQHLSGDENLDFEVFGTNYECPKFPHATCVKEIEVRWKGQSVRKAKYQPVYFNSLKLSEALTTFTQNGIKVDIWKEQSMTQISIKDINLVVTYYDEVPAYRIELPSFLYFNKTEGLCGICNFNESDDMYHRGGFIAVDIEDFAYSWLVNDSRENCTMPKGPLNPPPYDCDFKEDRCNMIVDPYPFVKSCENDAAYSQDGSTCSSKFMYAQKCCERGISLNDWLIQSACASCPEGMSYECISGCQTACENNLNISVTSCNLNPHYECVCPAGKAFKDGKCIDPVLCKTCDAKGHTVNDTWPIDDCTKCKCEADGEELHVKCTKTECLPEPICFANQTLSITEPSPGTCCRSYRCEFINDDCVTGPEVTCLAGEAKVMFIENNCPFYKCECQVALCPPPFMPPVVEEGEEYVLVKEGCCERYVSRCLPPTSCAPEPDCGVGFYLSIYEGKCCKKYSCLSKKDVCIFTHKHDVINGTEITLSESEQYQTEHKVGETWSDGPCRKCSCSNIDNWLISQCRTEFCSSLSMYSDKDKYQWKFEYTPGTCCPKFFREKCIIDGKILSAGESLPSLNGDKCKTGKCIMQPSGEVLVAEFRTFCLKNCPPYATYVEPPLESPECCGECKVAACTEKGKTYQVGDTWQSEIDHCMQGECRRLENGTILMYYTPKECPHMPIDCPIEQQIRDADGCCPHCPIEKESCIIFQVPIADTVGYFNLTDTEHGVCSNREPIENLKKCSGQCEAAPLYSKDMQDFLGTCKCCLPMETTKRTITLRCNDGEVIEKNYFEPSFCHCTSCGENEESESETKKETGFMNSIF